jgi:RNA polymerase sigma-70 factor, ECF subfamily
MGMTCTAELPGAGTVTAAMPEQLDERDLLASLAAGDRSAAEALVDRTYGKIYGLLCHLSGDREVAADLTQETYRRAWQALAGFDGRSQLSTWLYRIATNVFLNHVRRPRPVIPLEDEHEATIAAPGVRQDDEVIEGELAELLRRAVVTLPEEQRFVVAAYYWGEAPVRDIARSEGVSEVAIRKRLRRALAALRRAIGEVSR